LIDLKKSENTKETKDNNMRNNNKKEMEEDRKLKNRKREKRIIKIKNYLLLI